jgi:hypothetical protein
VLAPNIKSKSWFLQNTAQAIEPNIYLPKKIHDNLNSKNPDPKNLAILIHEQTHIKRQKEMGLLKWGIKYIFLPKFRFEEEILAIKAQMRYLKKRKIKFDIEKSAKYLSSWLYLRPVSYKIAKKELKRT